MGGYINDGNSIRKFANGYISDGTSNRKILKGWVGDANNVPQVIYTSVPPIPSFYDATTEEISDAIALHYTGAVDLSKVWNLGDYRETESGRYYIIGINETLLTTAYGVRTNSALTIMEVLDEGIKSKISSSSGFTNWEATFPYTKYCKAGTYAYNRIKTEASEMGGIKSVHLLYNASNGNAFYHDYELFIPSVSEIAGDEYTYYTKKADGTQYEYFKTKGNRIFPKGAGEEYWLRTLQNTSASTYASYELATCLSTGDTSCRSDVGSARVNICFCL